MGCARRQQKGGPLWASPSGLVVLVCCRYLSQASERSGGGQDSQSSDLGNCLRPAVDAEFTGKLKPTCVAKALILEIVLSPECDYVH
jgi:hypothetical protein